MLVTSCLYQCILTNTFKFQPKVSSKKNIHFYCYDSVRVLKLFTFWDFRFLRYHNGSKELPKVFLWYSCYKVKCFFLKYFLSSVTNKKSSWFAICIYNCQIGYFDSKRNLLITHLDILAMKKIFYQNILLYSLFRFILDRFLRKFCLN